MTGRRPGRAIGAAGFRPPCAVAALFGCGLALFAAACEDHLPGRKIAPGLGRNLAIAPGGNAAAFLTGAAHPDDRTVPEDLVAGDLWLADTRAGAASAAKVGVGVPSAAGAFAFRPDGGALAFLASWRFRAGEGELWVAAPGGAPRKLADGVKGFAWAPRGEAIAFIAHERLQVALRPLAAAADADGPRAAGFTALPPVHSFSWSPGAEQLAARAPASKGGGLLLLDAKDGTSRELAPSSDFLFAPDGALGFLGPAGPKGGDRDLSIVEGAAAPRPLGRATTFGFSPDGRFALLLSTEGSLGDAYGSLSRLPRAGGTPSALGDRVSEWRFTPGGDLLLLAGYDVRSRSGTLMLAPASGAAPREFAQRVQTFQLSPRGDRVIYVVQANQKGDFKVELWTGLLAEGPQGFAQAPRKLDEGVYGFQLSADGEHLFWKSRCGAGTRNCTLFRTRLSVTEDPVRLSPAVAGFDLAPEGRRLLVAHPHKGAPKAVDLALLDALGPAPVDQPAPFALEVDPGSRFLDPQGTRVIAPRLTGRSPSVLVIDLP